MAGFCVIEGADGSGKSHLAAALGDEIERAEWSGMAVVLKDTFATTVTPEWSSPRLAAMHKLTWSYDPNEPVWEYSSHYWLHTLAAWYSLFHQQCVRPLLETGQTVITDGWYFKHQARSNCPTIQHS